MSKKLLFSFVIILVAVIVVFVIFKSNLFVKQEKGFPLQAPSDLEIKEYGLEGKVSKVSGNKITMNAGIVYVGLEGNYINYEDKSVTISPEAKIYLIKKGDNGKYIKTETTVSSIIVGSKIATYSDKDIKLLKSYSTSKVEILQF